MQRDSSKNKFGRGKVLIIVFVWILLFAIPLLFGQFPNGINWKHIGKIWTEYGFVFLVFLINRLVLIPHLFFKGKKVGYFISISVLIIIIVSVVYVRTQRNQAQTNRLPGPPPFEQFENPPIRQPRTVGMQARPLVPAYANLLILTILLIGFDSGLLFFGKWMQSEQNKLKAEKESIKNKMDFLQTQISPHFFMNTLNNIHALVDIDTEEAKASIIKLSQLMDYMLYESQTTEVPLKQEMDFICSYVALMKLRFTDDVDIQLNIPNELPNVTIPPLLTIAFIENAFKYGISYTKTSFIHMHIQVDEEHYFMHVQNSIRPDKEERKNSGIGIENTRHRLDLIYGDRYSLAIHNENNAIFDVKLTLPL